MDLSLNDTSSHARASRDLRHRHGGVVALLLFSGACLPARSRCNRQKCSEIMSRKLQSPALFAEICDVELRVCILLNELVEMIVSNTRRHRSCLSAVDCASRNDKFHEWVHCLHLAAHSTR